VNLWRAQYWSAEEQRASGGRFDPRPFLLVRFPGNEPGEVRTESFPELETHGMIEGMLNGEIRSEGDLDRWLNAGAERNLAMK
jgi:hypothetical protein